MADEAVNPDLSSDDLAVVGRLRAAYAAVRSEITKMVVGQDRVIDELMIALFCRGHCLVVGAPGTAKTSIISALARSLSLTFNRIQFTPDLMPSDITGTEILQQDKSSGERFFKFLPGPIFANVILAAEINRTPPKTQAALLEAMQERQVTIAGERHPLEEPFFVLATQNQIEQEGTYKLPEAQLDRFMFNVLVDYPDEAEEHEIMKRTTAPYEASVDTVLRRDDLLAFQRIVRRVPIAEDVIRFAMRLVRLSRPNTGDEHTPSFVREWVQWGAGPRAGQFLVLGGKARALLRGRSHVSCGDVQAIAPAVLRHRIITNFYAAAEGVTSDTIVDRMVVETPTHVNSPELEEKLPNMFDGNRS